MAWPAFFFHSVLAAVCFARNEQQIVFPRMLESRTAGGQKVLKISEEITLNLEKSTIFPDEFFVHSTLDGTPIQYHMLGKEMEKNLYHDFGNMASVDVSEEDGLRIEGTLGHTLRIKPAPEEERSADGQLAHMLYHAEDPLSVNDPPEDFVLPPINHSASLESRSLRPKRGNRLPKKIYPEIHVVLDYIISEGLKFSPRIAARYIAILGNSANLRYRSMRQPRVQLKIVGISITTRRRDESYMVPVNGSEKSRNILNMETLNKFNQYVENQSYFEGSDIVFLLTGRNMSRWKNGVLETWIGGNAFMGAVCTKWKVGMSEERVGSFYGVYVFAHEIGHSLGCDHDQYGPGDWPAGVIGSKDCPWDDGYMMSYMFKDPNMYSFSKCCEREVLNILNRPQYTCLMEKNTKEYGVNSTRLPGEVSSRDTYCRKVYYKYKHVEVDRTYNEKPCTVKCFIDAQRWENMLISAVDGVRCGHQKYCALGQCLTKDEINKLE